MFQDILWVSSNIFFNSHLEYYFQLIDLISLRRTLQEEHFWLVSTVVRVFNLFSQFNSDNVVLRSAFSYSPSNTDLSSTNFSILKVQWLIFLITIPYKSSIIEKTCNKNASLANFFDQDGKCKYCRSCRLNLIRKIENLLIQNKFFSRHWQL